MVRVLHVVTYMGRGGLETMLMNYYRNIDRKQVQFDFLVHREERYDYDDEIEALGGIIYRIPFLNPFSMDYRKKLNQFFKEHSEYKIVHVHLDCMSSIVLKAAKKNNCPVRIAHSHSSNQIKSIKLPIKLFYKKLIPLYATNYMACSEDAGKWMFKEQNFQVLNNAIDAKKYIFDHDKRKIQRQKYGIKDEIIIGHVGRFAQVKNHSFLIDILYEMKKRKPAKLLLVGGKSGRPEEEEYYRQIKDKIKRLNLEDSVIFAGLCSNVHEILQAMDIFILPSLFEGLPVTIVEAQAAGLPCIISDKVPIECKKTNLVSQMPLTTDCSIWVDYALKLIETTSRRNTFEEIKIAEFDIQSNAERLVDYYLGLQ